MSQDPRHPKPAVVLLSGGLDSATTAAAATQQNFALHAVTFDYGQRHRVELDAAARIAQHLHAASHQLIKIDLRALGASALTCDTISVPKDRPPPPSTTPQHTNDIPPTYVPARNTIFLSYALAVAEVIDSTDIFIGVNAVDYSGYPDCRPQYIHAFQHLANLATKAAVQGHPITIHTPLIDLTKPQIIEMGLDLGVDFSLTHSCYDPDPQGRPCTHCDACLIRIRAFDTLGMTDPVIR